MTRPQVLLLSDPVWPEFDGPVCWLDDHALVQRAEDESRALAALRKDAFDIVVVGQRRPGEVPDAFFEAVRQAAPLTPIVCLLGSLCEGEMRSGAPWPGAIRSYAHRFVAQMRAQFERLSRPGGARWTLPFTATEEDRSFMTAPCDRSGADGRIAVISFDRQTRSALCDMFQSAGFSTTALGRDWERLDEAVDVVVCDCAAGFSGYRLSFDRVVHAAPQTPKILVLGFPRAHDIADARAQGAAAVVSKPFLVEELVRQVRDCLSS